MRFSVGCELSYTISSNTTLIFNIEPMRNDQQLILSERLTVTPEADIRTHVGPDTGNRYVRLLLPPGEHTIRYEGVVDLLARHEDPDSIDEIPVAELPVETLPFLNSSRYCLSDELGRFAQREFAGIAPGHNRVTAICNWINDRVDYLRGTSDTATTAIDTFASRAGVCRDFAHLGISLCRALGIPARFVSAYAWQLQPPDFHALFEAYLGDHWYLFDATRQAALDGIIRIGCGRDAADTAFSTIYGDFEAHPMRVWIDALDQQPGQDWTVNAVSVAAR
jgi:transglutaminase-like putative cysteine protease